MYNRVNFDTFAASVGANITDDTVFDTSSLPPDVRRAYDIHSDDRSDDQYRIVAACVRAGIAPTTPEDLYPIIHSRPDLHQRLMERRDGNTDIDRCWIRAAKEKLSEDAFFTPPPPKAPTDDVTDHLADAVNGEWLGKQTFPDLEYAVPGLIPEGCGYLVGPPKIGKSWLALNICAAVADGGTALGRISVQKRPVYYMALEDSYRRVQSRAYHLAGKPYVPRDLWISLKADHTDVLQKANAFLRRHPDALIVIDTLAKVRPPKTRGGDAYSEDYAVGGKFKDLADSYPGCTILLVHHTRKAFSPDFVDAISGTQGIAGSADFVLVVARKRHDDSTLLSVTGRDVPEGEYACDVSHGHWTLAGKTLQDAADTAAERETDKGSRTGTTGRILDYVRSRPTEDTLVADIELAVRDDDGQPLSSIRTLLSRLVKAGDVRRVGRGAYRPAGGDSDD